MWGSRTRHTSPILTYTLYFLSGAPVRLISDDACCHGWDLYRISPFSAEFSVKLNQDQHAPIVQEFQRFCTRRDRRRQCDNKK